MSTLNRTIFYVKPARKDGKHSVTFCFSAKRINKIMTPEQVQRYRDDPSFEERRL